jgi:shikimate dehydrogenase
MIINTSSLGMPGNDNLNLNLKEAKKNLYIYDLVYKPSQTNLLKEAGINNLNYQNGLAMLVHQAAESFRIWHGVYPEITNELFEILKS